MKHLRAWLFGTAAVLTPALVLAVPQYIPTQINQNLLDAANTLSAQLAGPLNGFFRTLAGRSGDEFKVLDYIPPNVSMGTNVGASMGNPSFAQLVAYRAPGALVQPYSVLSDPIAGYAPVVVLSNTVPAGSASFPAVSAYTTNPNSIPSWQVAGMMQSDDPATRWRRIAPGMVVSNLAGSPISCVAAGTTVTAVPQVLTRQFPLFPAINGKPAAVDYVSGMALTANMIVEANSGLWELTAKATGNAPTADFTYSIGTAGTGPTLTAPVSLGGPRYGNATIANGYDPGPWQYSYTGYVYTDVNNNSWTLRQRAEYEPLRVGTFTGSANTTAACPGATATVSISGNQLTINSIQNGGTIAAGAWVEGGGVPQADSVMNISATSITGLVSGTANTPGAVYSLSKSLGNMNNVNVIIGAPVQLTIDKTTLDNLPIENIAASAAAMWASKAQEGGNVILPAGQEVWNWPVISPGHTTNFNYFHPTNFIGQGMASLILVPSDASANMGGQACALTEAVATSQGVSSAALYQGFSIEFSGTVNLVNGTAGVREYSICLGQNTEIERVNLSGFFALGLMNDHVKARKLTSAGAYSVFFMPYTSSIGNFGCAQCGLGSNTIAGIGVSTTNAADSLVLTDTDNGYQPMGVYAGPPSLPNVVSAGGGGLSNFKDDPASTESIGFKWIYAPTNGASYINLANGGTPTLGNRASMINDGQNCQAGDNGGPGGLFGVGTTCDVWPPTEVIDASSIQALHVTGANWGPDFASISADPAITGGPYAGMKMLVHSTGACNDVSFTDDPGILGANFPVSGATPVGCASEFGVSFRNGQYQAEMYPAYVNAGQGHGAILGQEPVGNIPTTAAAAVYQSGDAFIGIAAGGMPTSGGYFPVFTSGKNIVALNSALLNGVQAGQFLFPTEFTPTSGVSGFAPALDPADAAAVFDSVANSTYVYLDLNPNIAKGAPFYPALNLTAGTVSAPYAIGQVFQSLTTLLDFTGPAGGGYVQLGLTPIGRKQTVCNYTAGTLTLDAWGTTTAVGTLSAAVGSVPTCHDFIRTGQSSWQ